MGPIRVVPGTQAVIPGDFFYWVQALGGTGGLEDGDGKRDFAAFVLGGMRHRFRMNSWRSARQRLTNRRPRISHKFCEGGSGFYKNFDRPVHH